MIDRPVATALGRALHQPTGSISGEAEKYVRTSPRAGVADHQANLGGTSGIFQHADLRGDLTITTERLIGEAQFVFGGAEDA